MYYSFLFTALMVALASGAALKKRTAEEQNASLNRRGCFGDGAKWGAEKYYALHHAKELCSGPFIGTFQHGDYRAKCFNLSNEKKVDSSLGIISEGPRDIGYDECYDGLQKEINLCGQGGRTRYTNWEYQCVVI